MDLLTCVFISVCGFFGGITMSFISYSFHEKRKEKND
jgi:predicted CDP-diglyceride synthetase/phosphatidate cytidylyltransferase